MLNALRKNDIHDVVFISGYHQEQLKEYVAVSHPAMNATWIENTEFDKTNTAASVFLSRDTLLASGDDVLLINGDVVLDHRSIEAVLSAPEGNVLATRLDRCGAEEVKVCLNEARLITEIGKHLTPDEAAGESVGINRLSRTHLPALFEMIGQRMETGNGRSEYYEHSFNALIQNGMEFRPADVTSLPVMEVDTPEDYETVVMEIAPRLQTS